jgi:hypothetical protein
MSSFFSPPQNIEDSMESWRPPLCAKHIRLKGGAIGNTFGEHIGNIDNILKGTCWEQRKNEKNPPLIWVVSTLYILGLA